MSRREESKHLGCMLCFWDRLLAKLENSDEPACPRWEALFFEVYLILTRFKLSDLNIAFNNLPAHRSAF